MSDADKSLVGSIPEVYDDYLVPLVFEAFVSDLAEGSGNGPVSTKSQGHVIVAKV